MKFFITGDNGFIGSHFVNAVIMSGNDVINPPHRVDILDDKQSLMAYCKSADVIIHCAAKIRGFSDEIYNTNIEGAVNVAEAAKGKLLINMGTYAKTGDYGKSKETAHQIFLKAAKNSSDTLIPFIQSP